MGVKPGLSHEWKNIRGRQRVLERLESRVSRNIFEPTAKIA